MFTKKKSVILYCLLNILVLYPDKKKHQNYNIKSSKIKQKHNVVCYKQVFNNNNFIWGQNNVYVKRFRNLHLAYYI